MAGMPAERALKQLWFGMLRREWSSLALVPTDPSLSARPFARALLDAGAVQGGAHLSLVDAEGADLSDCQRLLSELVGASANGGRAVVAVDALVQSLTGIPLALAAEAALLLVPLGRTDLAAVRSTVGILGRERVLGCVVVRED